MYWDIITWLILIDGHFIYSIGICLKKISGNVFYVSVVLGIRDKYEMRRCGELNEILWEFGNYRKSRGVINNRARWVWIVRVGGKVLTYRYENVIVRFWSVNRSSSWYNWPFHFYFKQCRVLLHLVTKRYGEQDSSYSKGFAKISTAMWEFIIP